jgi:hypothetical protein
MNGPILGFMPTENDHTKRPVHELKIVPSLFRSGAISALLSTVSDLCIGVKSYREVLSMEARAHETAGNHDEADTLQALFLIIDMSLNSGDSRKPFVPSSRIGNMRSPIPEDFTDDQIASLAEGATHLSDPIIRARILDVVWIRLRRIEAAKTSISEYLNAARDSRLMEMERFWSLERAFRLTKQIKFKDAWPECEKVFAEFREDPALYERLSIDLLALAQTFPIIEPRVIADEAKRLAESHGPDDPFKAKELSLIAATIFQKLDDKVAAGDCHRKVAGYFLAMADHVDAMNAPNFIEEAIEALRRAGAKREEIQEMNRLLIHKGQEAASQMKQIEGPKIDFTEAVKTARKVVEGLAPLDALKRLADEFPILKRATFEAGVRESMRKHPLQYLIQATHLTAAGRQYSRRASFTSDDPKVQQKAVDTEIAAAMSPELEAVTKYCLIPALQDVHWPSRDLVTLLNVLSHRPMVPPGRAKFYFSGIEAGLEGRFLDAAHILIPQLENSLRYLLEARGHVVTTLKSENLHSEMSLNMLFDNYRKEIAEMLDSDDLAYLMESFLCAKEGQNFRNELSHGLVSNPHDFRFAFAWWLAVHLIFRFKFVDEPESEDDKDAGQE